MTEWSVFYDCLKLAYKKADYPTAKCLLEGKEKAEEEVKVHLLGDLFSEIMNDKTEARFKIFKRLSRRHIEVASPSLWGKSSKIEVVRYLTSHSDRQKAKAIASVIVKNDKCCDIQTCFWLACALLPLEQVKECYECDQNVCMIDQFTVTLATYNSPQVVKFLTESAIELDKKQVREKYARMKRDLEQEEAKELEAIEKKTKK